MKLVSRSTRLLLNVLLFIAAYIAVTWVSGHLAIALIVAAVGIGLYLMLMLVVVSSERANPTRAPYAEGEDAEHAVLRTRPNFPNAWEDATDNVRELFSGRAKGSMDEQHYLEHINAVDAGQSLDFEHLSVAGHMKTFYEYRRKNGSLQYKLRGGNPMVDAVDAMRRLSDGERPEFIEPWKQFTRNDEEQYAKRNAAKATKAWWPNINCSLRVDVGSPV